VHIQANWDAADPVGETRWVQQVADQHGFPHGIVAHTDLSRSNVEAVLEAHCEHANMRGIRHILGHTDDPDCSKHPDYLSNPVWENGYAALARYGLSFDCQLFPLQMEAMAEIAARHDNIPLVICHTGFPWDRSDQGRALWRRGMAKLAELPHCYAKLSGPGMVMPDWTTDRFAEFIHTTIDLFGPGRCMFASNVPPDALCKTYDEIYQGFYSWAAGYSEEECDALFYSTAAKFYRL
jgi:predicted TIM-barrel fold metal-dependent hydrolase